jgi:hypothetical protein
MWRAGVANASQCTPATVEFEERVSSCRVNSFKERFLAIRPRVAQKLLRLSRTRGQFGGRDNCVLQG